MTDPDDLLRRLPAPTPEDEHVDDGRLVAWRAGHLAEAETAQVDGHLARCADCRDLAAALADPVPATALDRARRAGPKPRRWPGALLDRARGADRSARRWPLVVTTAASLAAAAALVLWLVPREPAPGWRLEGPLGGLAAARGDGPTTSVFVPDSQVRLILRPEGAPSPGEVALFGEGPDGRLRRVFATLTAGPGGALRVEASGRALFGDTAGRRRGWIAIADPATLSALHGEAPDVASSRLPTGAWHAFEVEYAP